MSNYNSLWAILATAAPKRFDRSLLQPGEVAAKVSITATINGVKLKETLTGTFAVNADSTRTTTSKPSLETLLSAVLYQVSPKKRREILSALSAGLTSDQTSDDAAKELILAHTKHGTGTVRGSLAFDPN